MANNKAAKVKISRSVKTENRLKTALYYAIELLFDVIIVYVCIRAFSISFSFAYDVFHDKAKNLADTSYVIVDIEPDSSSSAIAGELYDAGVIDNKYVMMVRIKVGEYGKKIKPGSYGLSASMTYNEILDVITGDTGKKDASDSSETGSTGNEDVATGTDAIDPNLLHDNSDSGAGEGADEIGEDIAD